MSKWKSLVEINSQVWRSLPWRKHSGNRLNWRQAPFARVSCVLCSFVLRSTAWIGNAAHAVHSGACPRLHLLPVGKEVGQHIPRYNHRTYRGNPIHVWPRCCPHRLHPNFLERRRHQEPLHKFEVPLRRVQIQDTADHHLRKVRHQEPVCDPLDLYYLQTLYKTHISWIPVQSQASACIDGFAERNGQPRSRLINVRRM